MWRPLSLLALFSTLTGCCLVPDIAHEPTLHNPFPQLSRVAVAPFFNQSTEATVDGRQFALAYFNELQLVPGFEVVPVDVVEQTIAEEGIRLENPADVRRLARELEVDAVVLGTVTDFSPYYPPRCGLRVEWYAANTCFHPIPPGYGLPWGTPGEEHIPDRLVFEAELALAKEQLKTQTPPVAVASYPEAAPEAVPEAAPTPVASSYTEGLTGNDALVGATGMDTTAGTTATALPPDWPDARGFISPPPTPHPPPCWPNEAPVMQHTRAYNGHDSDFTEALSSYYYFRDDARFGGWQSYLERSEDFIRFCCHKHIWEMLSARGGAGKTRVVLRWFPIR